MDIIIMIFEGVLDVLVMVGSAVKVLLGILPFVFIIIIAYLIFSYREDLQYRRITGSRILELDSLPAVKLRFFMLYLLRWLGYEEPAEEEAPENNDQSKNDQQSVREPEGVDILVEKDGIRYAVLIERKENGVGQRAFRKLEHGMERYNCEKGIIINTGYFNNYDQEAAGYGDIELWDRQVLIKELLNLQGIEDNKGRGFNYYFQNFFRWVWHGG